MVDIEKLEKVRGMTARELMEEYGLSENRAYNLKTSVRPDRYEVLADNRLTSKEMTEKLGLSMGYVGSCRSALTSTGLADRKEASQRKIIDKDVGKRTVSFLEKKPSSLAEIEDGVVGFYNGALYQKKIGSIGPDKHKIYYVKGREELARKELEKRLAEPEKLVLEVLTRPMPLENLCKENKLSNEYLSRLVREGKINRVKSFNGGKKGEKYCILEKDHVYKPGQEQQMADLIIQGIAQKNPKPSKMNKNDKRSLTNSIKGLQKPLFEIVHDCYLPKVFKPERIEMEKVEYDNKVISETMRNLKKIIKDFGLEVITQEDMVKYIGVLSGYGLLDNNAYEIRKEQFFDTVDYRTSVENVIQWNSPKLKNNDFPDKDIMLPVGNYEENLERVEKEVELFLKYSK